MKQKILFTIPNFDTAGSGWVVLDLIQGLKDEFEIHVACNHERGELFQLVKNEGIKIHIIEFCVKGKPYVNLLKRMQPIIKFFRENKFDLIHSWHYNDDWTEALAARIAGCTYIYTKKNMSWSGKDWKIRTRLSKFVFTINTSMKRDFFPKNKNVRYIPIGIDTNDFKYNYKAEDLFVNQFPANSKIILSVANMIPVKGIETAIEALAKLDDKSACLALVGAITEEYKSILDGLIEKLCLQRRVKYFGLQKDVRPFLSSADVFVITTLNIGRKEGQGIAPIEAMSVGLPVISSYTSGLIDVMEGLEDWTFEPGSSDQLAERIESFFSRDDQSILSLSEDVSNKMKSRFDLKDFIEAYKKVYLEVLS